MSTLELLERIAHETCFTAAGRCQVRGVDVPLPERLASIADDPSLWVRAASEALGKILYEVYYLRRPLRSDRFQPTERRIKPVDRHEHHPFARLLREANAGSGWLSEGFGVIGRDADSRWRVSDGHVTLTVGEDEIVPPDGGPLAPGGEVSIRFPKHLPYISLGYYLAVSDAGPVRVASEPACRMYMNVQASFAPRMLRLVTSLLCSRRVRASVKVLNDPEAFGRPDALVLLLERSAFDDIRADIEALLTRSAAHLGADIPAFTKLWMPGVAMAEEPVEHSLSFGEHRSRLIAAGIARAHAGAGTGRSSFHASTAQQRHAQVLDTLREASLSPERLYLNPGSTDIYPESRDLGAARRQAHDVGPGAP